MCWPSPLNRPGLRLWSTPSDFPTMARHTILRKAANVLLVIWRSYRPRMSESLSGFALLFIWIAESFELVYENVQNSFTNLASLKVQSFPFLWLDVPGCYFEQACV